MTYIHLGKWVLPSSLRYIENLAEIFEFDAAWAEIWTKTGMPFLSALTVGLLRRQKLSFLSIEYSNSIFAVFS